jgi:predicted enzyme related to lactoylglutathione lyase
MTAARLSFFKLLVRDLATTQRFYETALGFSVHDRFDTPDFEEVLLRQKGSDLMLVLLHYTDGRAIPAADNHGPTGFVTDDITATHAALVKAGGKPKGAVIEVEGIKVAFLDDPDGHEIELVQFSA